MHCNATVLVARSALFEGKFHSHSSDWSFHCKTQRAEINTLVALKVALYSELFDVSTKWLNSLVFFFPEMGMRFKQPTFSNLPLCLLIHGGFSTNCTSTTGVSEKKKVWSKTVKTFNFSMMDKSTMIFGF